MSITKDSKDVIVPLSFSLSNVNNICMLASKTEPFFCYLLSGIKINVGVFKGFEYMACTSSTIFIQQKFIDEVQQDKSKLKEFTTVFIHEIYHIFLHHSWRYGFSNNALYAEHRDKGGWLPQLINCVLDAIINTNLISCNYSFGSLTDYITLKTLLDKDHPRINDNNWNEDELLNEVLNNSQINKVTSSYSNKEGEEGEGDITVEHYEITFPSGKTLSTKHIERDILFSENATKEELDAIESLKEIAKKGANNFRNSGKNPGSLSSKLLPPEIVKTKDSSISWEDKLKQLVITSTNFRIRTNYDRVIEDNFYSYEMGLNPFNKCPVEYPYKPLPKPNTIAVYIDLSGSIFGCPDTLSKFLFQITEISEYVGNLLLLTFDDGITGSYLFDMSEIDKPLGDLLLEEKDKYLLGGGGTDVIPLFEEFFNDYSKCNIEVDVNNICMLVVLTDLWLEQVNKELEPINFGGVIPTIWAVPEDHNTHNSPNFGEVLVIK